MLASMRAGVARWLVLGSLLSSGCYLSHGREGDAGVPMDAARAPDAGTRLDAGGRDAGVDAAEPHDAGTPRPDAFVPGCDAAGLPPIVETDLDLDLLFVVDNSGSMAQEQVALTENFPRMIRSLATGDLDGDGTPDFPPVRDLHVGVVTTDMGTRGMVVPTCRDPERGEDGVLRTAGLTSAGCMATYPSFLTFAPATGSVDALARDFACVAVAGTGGCGMEQPLEAALKALTPSTSTIRFYPDTTGHGDGPNAGFVRPDSFLAIVVVTDEDDCSARDPELFNPTSVVYTDQLFLRCAFHEDALHPVERYVDGLRALRSDRPERLLVAAIAGVPADLLTDPAGPDFEGILADSRMQVRVSLISGAELVPACTTLRRGDATPGRRMVRIIQGLGEAGILQSICAPRFDGAVSAITSRLGTRIREARCEGR